MLKAPELQETLLASCLHGEYGLRVERLTFLPIGADVNSAVYRVEADDRNVYFLKLRRGLFDEMSLEMPRFLSDLGITQIIAPLRTTSNRLWHRLEPFTMALYPFAAGSDAYNVALSERQWIEFGTTLRRIHDVRLPPALARSLPRETYAPDWRERVRRFQTQLPDAALEDRLSDELATFMAAKAEVVRELVEGAERLAELLHGRPQTWNLCHADIHAGNLLVAANDTFYIVDWDTALLAPKERDLMFIGSGLGRGWNGGPEEGWFYQGYGPTKIDPKGIAYYRCERLVQDIVEFCAQILSATAGEQDRAQSLRYLLSNFRPGGVAEIALRSYRSVKSLGLL
jgi:spectinomycin phosphotransferase